MMLTKNINSVFLTGDCVRSIVIQSAIYWAEFGEVVWYICPEPFNSIPEEFYKVPDKEVLKFIIFLYISNPKDLIKKFSDMHMLPKLPKAILIPDIDYYASTKSKNQIDVTSFAFLLSVLIDGTSVYSKKYMESCFFITSMNFDNHNNEVIETVLDFYLSHKLDTNCTEVFNNIKILFKT